MGISFGPFHPKAKLNHQSFHGALLTDIFVEYANLIAIVTYIIKCVQLDSVDRHACRIIGKESLTSDFLL